MDEERVAAEKAAWRARFRAARAAMAPAERAAASDAIAGRVWGLVAGAPAVSLFWPLVGRGEVDVRPLVGRLVAAGATVALPAVAPEGGLVHRAVRGGGDLVGGPFGLSEPGPSCPEVPPAAVAVAVVPALGLGRDGGRLGYGGGYYDRYLAETPALRVGVAWAGCLADRLPAGPHDARLDAVVTERETVWTGRRPGPAPGAGA